MVVATAAGTTSAVRWTLAGLSAETIPEKNLWMILLVMSCMRATYVLAPTTD